MEEQVIVEMMEAEESTVAVVADDKRIEEPATNKGEEDTSFDPSTLLPNELWVRILSLTISHSSPHQLLPLRLVHPSWRNLIDEHFSFSVIIHDDRSNFSSLPESLKIKDCLITKLTNPPPTTQESLFNHPEYLRRVRFWGSIHPPTFFKILRSATNLEELSLTRYPLTQRDLFYLAPKKILLNKLTKLEILGYCCKDVSEAVKTNFQILLKTLSEIPNLHRIFVNITADWRCMDHVLKDFLLFLIKHKNLLTHLNCSLVPAVVNGTQEDVVSFLMPPVIDQDTLQQLYDDSFQVESLRLSLAPKYVSVWLPVVQKQTKLRDLRLHWICSSCEQQVSPTNALNPGILRVGQLLSALKQSSATLVHLDLREISLSVDAETRQVIPFDLEVLSQAKNLKKLILVRNKEDCLRNSIHDGATTLINLALQFPSLEELEIVRFKVFSSELEVLIEGTGSSLRTVKLQHTGSVTGQGVHPGILMTLMDVPGMKTVNVCPLSYSSEPGVNGKLDQLRARFGSGIFALGGGGGITSHIYFDFRRWQRRRWEQEGLHRRYPKRVTKSRFRRANSLERAVTIANDSRTRRNSN